MLARLASGTGENDEKPAMRRYWLRSGRPAPATHSFLVAYGVKADLGSLLSPCPLWVISGHRWGALGMSALPPEADRRAKGRATHRPQQRDTQQLLSGKGMWVPWAWGDAVVHRRQIANLWHIRARFRAERCLYTARLIALPKARPA